MARPTGAEIARHYEAAAGRIADLALTLTDDQLDRSVAATPGWTVRGVVAHLAALTTDVLAGRLTGMPTDDFTDVQVAERAGRSAKELVDEWGPNIAPMCDGARAGLIPPNLAVDALTHEQDIRGTLRLPPVIDADELRFCTTLYASGCAYGVRTRGLPVLAIRSSDTGFERLSDDGEPQASVTAPEFELFRVLSGRRSRRQAAGYDWTGNPEPYLDAFSVFGPLPDTDLSG